MKAIGGKVSEAINAVKDNVSVNVQQNGSIEAVNNSGGNIYYSSSKEASSGAYSISFTVYAGEFEKKFSTVIDVREVELNNKKLLIRAILHAISAGVISINNSTDVAINFPFDITVGIKLDVKELSYAERDSFLEDISSVVNLGVDNGVYSYMESQKLPLPKDVEVVDNNYVKQSTEFEFMSLLNNCGKAVSSVVEAVGDVFDGKKDRPVPEEALSDLSIASWDSLVRSFELVSMALDDLKSKTEDFREITGKTKSKTIESFTEYTKQSLEEYLLNVKERYAVSEVDVEKTPKYNENKFISLMSSVISEMEL